MADLVRKPGVEITQVIQTTTPAAVLSTLSPCLIGPAFEVVDAVENGVANSAAVVSGKTYRQLGNVISAAEFPSPNGVSADERSVESLTAEISATINLPSGPRVLNPRRPSAFLDWLPDATRPAVHLKDVPPAGDYRFYASSMSAPLVVTVKAADTIHTFASEINRVTAGQLVASSFDTGVAIVTLPDTALSFGTSAFIEIAGSVNTPGGIRVFGSGLFASLTGAQRATATVGYSKGRFIRADLSDAGPDADATLNDIVATDIARPAFIPVGVSALADMLVAEFPDAVSFTTYDLVAARPQRDGDVLVCDGYELGMITAVRATTIDVATINTALSTYNADGTPLVQRYSGLQLTSAFSPRRAYFVAKGVMGGADTERASVKIDLTNVAGYTAGKVASISFGHPNLDDGNDSTAVFVANTTLLLSFVDIERSEETVYAFSFAENYGTTQDLVDEMNRQLSLQTDAPLVNISADDQNVVVKSVLYGASAQVSVLSSDQGSSATSAFVDAAGNEFTSLSADGSDAIINALPDAPLVFTLDHSYGSISVRASSKNVMDFARQINMAVGANVATFDENTDEFIITSRLYGRASHVSVGKFDAFGMAAVATDSGAGRPFADILVNLLGEISIGAQILRNAVTGRPNPMDNMSYGIGVSYRALRLDLSPAAADPGILRVSSVNDLTAFMSPIDTRNPLALAIYYALLNGGTSEINALGVDEVTSSEPDGSALSYARALEMIEAHEVYSVVPLTHSEQVIQLCHAHVNTMSLPENKHERILLASPTVSTRKLDEVASSGETASYTGTINSIDTGDSALEDAVSSLGFDTSSNIPALLPDGRSLVITLDVGGSVGSYSIIRVSGSIVTIRVSGMPNTDGFFTTRSVATAFTGATYSVFARGARLLVPGTNRLDRAALASTTRDRSQQYASRRHVRLFPDEIQSVIGGVEQLLPMYYFAAGLSGAVASEAASRPLTGYTVLGFSNVPSYDLSDKHKDVIAAGNMIVHVDQPGTSPVIRMQCTTDVDFIENRELSIVKAVDSFAKTLRTALKRRVGRFNITQTYIDETSIIVDSLCTAAVDAGILASASISKLEQDINAKDTLIVEVQVGTYYPGNYIKVTIVV